MEGNNWITNFREFVHYLMICTILLEKCLYVSLLYIEMDSVQVKRRAHAFQLSVVPSDNFLPSGFFTPFAILLLPQNVTVVLCLLVLRKTQCFIVKLEEKCYKKSAKGNHFFLRSTHLLAIIKVCAFLQRKSCNRSKIKNFSKTKILIKCALHHQ